MLDASDTGAEIYLNQIPYSSQARELLAAHPEVRDSLITSGDDYELCFCVPPAKIEQFKQVASNNDMQFTEIGHITATKGLRCVDETGKVVELDARGYSHFAKE